MHGDKFKEEPITELGIMLNTISGTKEEIQSAVDEYISVYPKAKFGTQNLGDAIFTGLRPYKWGDPRMEWGHPMKGEDVYELKLARRIHER